MGLASAFIRRALRFGGHLSGRERASFARLRTRADDVRTAYLAKPVGKGNVAALEYVSLVHVQREPIRVEATSRHKSPSPLPRPRSQGGYFEPAIDPSTKRPMNTDAEYKALSELARRLDGSATWQKMGVVYLFTELQPCASCASVIAQFEERFPLVTIVIAFDHPFP
ncbi:deaminase domain-containing protein [Sorangium sp. So ce1153]|uniref:deaminase domain-containing protein n=1 Tax=Sorangium sp. So ce1153 TaxID=3133333 RepID=UPI003F64154D